MTKSDVKWERENKTRHALTNVIQERARQEQLKAAGRFPFTCADDGLSVEAKLDVLAEEFGEVARCVLECAGLVNDKHHADAKAALRKELIEVAAVAVAWAESL